MGRIVAIDWGAKRTGLAWTDPLKLIATGIGSIDTALLEKKLIEIHLSEVIDCVVLGYPTRFDGSPNQATGGVLSLEKRLKKTLIGVPVELWDERLTSKMAMQSMIAGGVPRKKRADKQLINEVSAVIILQEYLENQSRT